MSAAIAKSSNKGPGSDSSATGNRGTLTRLVFLPLSTVSCVTVSIESTSFSLREVSLDLLLRFEGPTDGVIVGSRVKSSAFDGFDRWLVFNQHVVIPVTINTLSPHSGFPYPCLKPCRPHPPQDKEHTGKGANIHPKKGRF